jgi:endo-1,4-beta-D-glucanase Y
MLASRPPRPARPGLALCIRVALASPIILPLAYGCTSAGSDGSGTAGTSGSAGASGSAGTSGGASGTAGVAGRGGTTGAAGTSGSAGTTGAAGRGGTTGAAGSTGGSAGGAGAGGGTAGTGGGSAGGSGSAGTAGAAGSAAGRGGTTGSAGTSGTTGAAGTSGTAGTTGAGGTTVASTCGAGPPSAPASGAAFPFPQHRASSNCIYPPACSDNDMAMGWAAYKTALIVADGTDGSMRVARPENSNDTVSEGISYGMLFAVYMNDKTTFDAIWKYEQKHTNTHGLMHWHINSSGTIAGMNSATDADEDMAFALVMADKQWGGYSATANTMLTSVAANDFGTDGTIKGGDYYVAVNPSYIAPAFYRVFAAYVTDATQKTRWMTILDKNYDILAMAQNATSGLVPDWSAGPAANTSYGYDATRTPFRIALDVCWSGDARGKAFSQKIGAFFAGIGAANIVDGYSVTGTKTGSNKNSTFIGPAGAAGMASNQPQLVADAYMRVSADAKASTTNYFDRSWALFTVMLMTGNFVNFQSP